jgi:hypothetical protein
VKPTKSKALRLSGLRMPASHWSMWSLISTCQANVTGVYDHQAAG